MPLILALYPFSCLQTMNQFTMRLLRTKYCARNYGEGCSEADLASSLNKFWKLRGGKSTQIGITKDDGMRAIVSYRVQRSSEKLKKKITPVGSIWQTVSSMYIRWF